MGINGNVTCGNHSDGNCQNFPFNPLNAELNPICHLLALLGAHHIFHVNGVRVKLRLNKQIKEDRKNVTYVNYF